MEHEELADHLLLEVKEGFRFTDDQSDVMYAYHEGSGRVCVGSGAGTGKTTTLTRVVAEAVVRMSSPNPEHIEQNPFDEILVTTFTRDAAGQLKSTIKSILRDHQENSPRDFDPALWRWLETDSNISTIDAFIGQLLREIAPEVRVAPGFDVRDELETQDILTEVIRELESGDDAVSEAIEFLEEELGDDEPPVRQYIYDIHQKLREFCYSFPHPDEGEGTTLFSEHMRESIHGGREPPFGPEDVLEIANELTGLSRTGIDEPDAETVERIGDDYHHSLAFADAVETVLDEFNLVYDQFTRAEGALSYQDITYIVWEFLESPEGQELSRSLKHRFSHIFIDEFQDTSYAQCQILSNLIENEDDPTQVLVIGDVKQSIYGWRSADPAIFASILEHAASEDSSADEYLGATNWDRQELITNFRSHPHLVHAGNHLFNQVFGDSGRGGIGTFPVNHGPLVPHRPETNPENAHLHILPLGDCNADTWRRRDPQRVAATIRGMVDENSVEVGDGDEARPAEAGDVTILFRRSTHIPEFRAALDDYGLESAVVAERGLFGTEEVGFLVDVLDWFANPHSKDSLLRILRSPVTALSDRTLRFLASKNLNLPWALDDWPEDDLPEGDRIRLQNLIDLRSDLRWDREGSKANLVQKIIQHTAIETILLAGEDAIQRYGNLWMLVEVVRDWEDEELLPYREFVDQLRRYQEMARGGEENFEVSQVADSEDKSTVKLRTAHSSKGLEFDIVVLADLLAGPGGSPQSMGSVQFRDPETGSREYALRPRPAGEPVEFDAGPGNKWIQQDYHSTIWLAPEREDDGGLRYDHPFIPAWQDQLAEFWRLLYVAYTRAGDHVILPLGDSVHWAHYWSTWADVLLNVFQEGGEWDEPDHSEPILFSLDEKAQHSIDESFDGAIPFDVGLLPEGDEKPADPLGLPEFDETAVGGDGDEFYGDTADLVPFLPRELKPSTLHDLIACPRRFQYRALQEVSESRGESPPGTNEPEDISPSYWGTLVHDALEALHHDVQSGSLDENESHLADFFEDQEAYGPDLRSMLTQYRNSTTWETVSRAETVLPEYELSALHPDNPKVHISGFVDLLFQSNGTWEIVDFKTGTPPTADSYLSKQYRWQLATYAWLLREEYNIESVTTRLLYVQSGKEVTHEIERESFTEYLRELPDRLTLETGEGLQARPDPDPADVRHASLSVESRCGSCPYSSICSAW